MKPRSHILPVIALALCTPAVQAQSTTFSFRQGDLRKDGVPFGSADAYSGALGGHISDANAVAVMTSGATATIGNQFRNTDPTPRNGQNFVALFSYDLSELNDFITANTTSSSSVTIDSVAFRLVSTGGSGTGSTGAISLFRTDPFTTAASWSTTDGEEPWSTPYQNLGAEIQYKFTGGGSALSVNLGGTSPAVNAASQVPGTVLQWTSSVNFTDAIGSALGRDDRTLYLMAARPLGNADGRVAFGTGTAAGEDARPELVITVSVTSNSDWTGTDSNSWATPANWTTAPSTGDSVRFNNLSTANLATVLNQNFDLNGIALTDPAGPVSIGGADTLTLGAGGIDLSTATQNLSITAPIILGDAQAWNVAADRTLAIHGAVTGSGNLAIFGAGRVLTGAENILPNGAGAGNVEVIATLDLNGFSQSVNGLTGNGIVAVTGGGAATLTIGNNDAAGTFGGMLEDGEGTLSVVKTGAGNLFLTGASSFSGGFIKNGSGHVYPQNNGALGTGPVVVNEGNLYSTTGNYTYPNAVTLNGASLRVGGGNNRAVTWNGPVVATGTSGLAADGGATGITLGSTLDITGATFNTSGTTHNIIGDISGAGGVLNVNAGTLQLSGNNTYDGATTLNGSAVLRLQPTGTISNSSNVIINGTGNFNVRNTNNWTYSGTITGEGTGSINLNTATNATLAGPVSGVATIVTNNPGTDATVSGPIRGAVAVSIFNTATLRLSGANTYSGATTLTSGTLVLAASDVLPDESPVIIANATLDAASASETAATLAVTGAATIRLGSGSALAFAASHETEWTGAGLNITGDFVSGSSLRFGSDGNGLTPEQLAVITASGYDNFALNSSGFLTATIVGTPFDIWAGQIADPAMRGREDDADGDGFTNIQEYLFGTSPVAGNGSLVTSAASGGNLTLRWLQRESGATYTLKQSTTLAAGSWSAVVAPLPAVDADQSGAPADYEFHSVTLPIGTDKRFLRVEAGEN